MQKVSHPQRAPGYPLPSPGSQKENLSSAPPPCNRGGAHGDAGHTDPKAAQAAYRCVFPDHVSPLYSSPAQFHRRSTHIYFLKIIIKKKLKSR